MTIRERNKQKKMLKCLKCGRLFRTDICHRTCPKCKKGMYGKGAGIRPVHLVQIGEVDLSEISDTVTSE